MGANGDVFCYQVRWDLYADVHCADREPSFLTPPHMHDSLEFMYVKSGTLRAEIGGEEYIISPGNMAAVSSFSPHAFSADDKTTARLLIIPRHYLSGFDHLLNQRTFGTPVCPDDADHTIYHMLEVIYNICNRCGIYENVPWNVRMAMLPPFFQTFLHTLIQLCGLKDSIHTSPLIVSAMEYIHTHHRERIRIPQMAKELLCHQQTLTDQFHKAFGMTITAYVNRLRAIDVYTSLARDATLTLAEASEAAGFGSVRSMLRAYREVYGTTPSNNR